MDEFDTVLRSGAPASEKITVLMARFAPVMPRPPREWLGELLAVVEQYDPGLFVVRRLTSDLAFEARRARASLPDFRDLAPAEHGSIGRLIVVYLRCQRLRFDYRFAELVAFARRWLGEFPDDALLLAFLAGGCFGQGTTTDLARREAVGFLDRSLRSPNADQVSRTVCLYALWLGSDPDDLADRMLTLADDIVGRGEDDYYHHYLRTAALRRRADFESAIESINRAMTLLPDDRRDLHQDYVRERELTNAVRVLDRRVNAVLDDLVATLRTEIDDQVRQASKRLATQAERVQNTLSDSLLRVVEIIGLFVALVGFLAAGGFLTVRATSFWQHFGAIALTVAATLGFFTLLRWVVHNRPGAEDGDDAPPPAHRRLPRQLRRVFRLRS